MTSDDIERFDLRSASPVVNRLAALAELFPEVMREGRIEFDALRRSLGDWVDPNSERFGLVWPGKAECMRVIQEPSIGTLVPMPEESVDWDTTQNIIIEGENLEVLKLLQKAYYGKIKLIYIDPPYNTGKEFIYPDNFKEGLADYLKYSGQVDDEGFKLSANTETDGRYHSKWLSMMHPRLFLARNLLCEDGVIFVSIDDHEVHNLRSLMNEIFGEENFLAMFSWVRTLTPPALSRRVKTVVEYVLAFEKSRTGATLLGIEKPVQSSNPLLNQSNPVGVLAFPVGTVAGFKDTDLAPGTYGTDSYDVELLDAVRVRNGVFESSFRLRARFRWTQNYFDQQIKDGVQIRIATQRLVPNYERESYGRETVPNLIDARVDVGTNESARSELLNLLGDEAAFTYPKPVSLVKYLLNTRTSEDDLILDFFAGSGTTAQAMMELNFRDAARRRFILVQLPEPVEHERFVSIAEATRERVRGAAEQFRLEHADARSNLDLGFRAFRLSASNFTIWDAMATDADGIATQLAMHVDHLTGTAIEGSMLTELLLKAGFSLTAPVEPRDFAGVAGYSIADGALLVCLSDALTIEAFESMAELGPSMILVLDKGFSGNDELKVNALQTVRARNQHEGSDITLKVV